MDQQAIKILIIIVIALPLFGAEMDGVKARAEDQAAEAVAQRLEDAGVEIVLIQEYNMYVTNRVNTLTEFLDLLEEYRIDTVYRRGRLLFMAFVPPVSPRYPPLAFYYYPLVEVNWILQTRWVNE